MGYKRNVDALAKRMKELRIERGYSIETVAEAIHCSVKETQELEEGRGKQNILLLQYLAEFYFVSLDYLLGRTDDRTPYWYAEMLYTFSEDELEMVREKIQELLEKNKNDSQ